MRTTASHQLSARSRSPRETVVLIHGIWMHGVVLGVMAKHLRSRGFRAKELSYDFLRQSPAENADDLAREIQALDGDRFHIVAHSLGGIVTMHLMERHPELSIGKLVLLGSPVRGSDVARRIHATPLLRPLLGRSVEAGLLGGAPGWSGEHPLGIINGSGSGGLPGLIFPPSGQTGEQNDGVVAASETLADAATDSVTVPRSHSTMLFSEQCADLAARFIRTGRFS